MSAAVRISGLKYAYPENGGFKISGLDFEAKQGEFIALAGPNGAGKSTLIKIIAGIIQPLSGEVHVSGKGVREYKTEEFAKMVSYIPQTENYVFDYSLFDIVAMGRRPYTNSLGLTAKEDISRIESALEIMELAEKKYRKFSSLSGGEKRAGLVARAICQEADILLMDEPTTYLDIHHQGRLMGKVAGLNNEGKTIIMASHSLNIASEYAGRVIFINSGRIANDGAPSEIINEENIWRIFGEVNVSVESNGNKRPKIFLKRK